MQVLAPVNKEEKQQKLMTFEPLFYLVLIIQGDEVELLGYVM